MVKVVRAFGLQKHAAYASSVFLKRLLEARPDHGRLRSSEVKVNALHQDWTSTISRTQLDVDELSSDVQKDKISERNIASLCRPLELRRSRRKLQAV